VMSALSCGRPTFRAFTIGTSRATSWSAICIAVNVREADCEAGLARTVQAPPVYDRVVSDVPVWWTIRCTVKCYGTVTLWYGMVRRYQR
jgi:hypothetical protein